MNTPWGRSDYQKKYGEGVISYGTPSHGGFHLSAERNAQVHESWRNSSGWYEEDCDWAIVAITFPDLFTAEEYEHAKRTAQNWKPKGFTAVFGIELTPETSYILAARAKGERWATVAE